MPITLHGVAAGRGKPVQVFTTGVASSVDVQVPRSSSLPLRPVMTLEPAAPVIEEARVEEKEIAEKKVEEKKPAERTVIVRSDPRKPQTGRQDPRFANSKVRKAEVRPEPQVKAPEKLEPVEAVAAIAPVAVPVIAPVVAPMTAAEISEKKIVGNAPDAKPEIKPAPRPDMQREMPAPLAKPYTSSEIALPKLFTEPSGGFWSRLPVVGKIGIAALIALAIGGTIYATSKGGNTNAATSGPRIVEAPALPSGDAGWNTDWGTEPGVRRQHDISILRSSMSLTDYRMEFQAQIENKALAWVYRAQDGKNFYVSKLEIVKAGLDPTVALIRFAVINGEEQPRAQFPLSMKTHLDTLYNIRFDAVGDHFTTFVQDQKVDDFTDDRIRMGGVGLYSEHGERLGLKGSVRVVPLVIKK
jgi:hypothetical protein